MRKVEEYTKIADEVVRLMQDAIEMAKLTKRMKHLYGQTELNKIIDSVNALVKEDVEKLNKGE